jgi:hypothetical protein
MQIFISYSRVDKGFALRLANNLKEAGFKIWLDVLDIPHGTNWDLEVQRGLENSDTMLVLLSPTASASDNVRDEWHYFIEKKRRIIPLMIQPNEVPFRLSRRQRIDFTNKPYDQALTELVNALNEPDQLSDATTDRLRVVQTRTLPMSWGNTYSAWQGLSPVMSGQAQVNAAELRLLAPERLPTVIPLTSITAARVVKTAWDTYIALEFVDRATHPARIYLMGTERAKRKATQADFLAALSSATGKRFS